MNAFKGHALPPAPLVLNLGPHLFAEDSGDNNNSQQHTGFDLTQ